MAITIRSKEHGPYLFAVEDAPRVAIVDAAGRRLEPTPEQAIALWRCGHSSRKSLGDETHRTVSFHCALTEHATECAGAPPAATSLPIATHGTGGADPGSERESS